VIAYLNRGIAYARKGSRERGIADLRLVIEQDPTSWLAHQELAWILATCPADLLRNPQHALALATKACELTKHQKPSCLDALAAACAATGAFPDAAKWQAQAMESPAYPAKDLAAAKTRLDLYRAGKPWREGGH